MTPHWLDRLGWKVRGVLCLFAGHVWKPVFCGERSYVYCERCQVEVREP